MANFHKKKMSTHFKSQVSYKKKCVYEALLFLRILIARLHSHHAGVVLKSNYSDMRVRHACRAVPQSAGAFGGHQHSKFRVILCKNQYIFLKVDLFWVANSFMCLLGDDFFQEVTNF